MAPEWELASRRENTGEYQAATARHDGGNQKCESRFPHVIGHHGGDEQGDSESKKEASEQKQNTAEIH
jgi:hypothetical protein